jgi:hypothetical protein
MEKKNRNYGVELQQVWRLIMTVGQSWFRGNSVQLRQQSNNWWLRHVMDMLSLRQKVCLAGDINCLTLVQGRKCKKT